MPTVAPPEIQWVGEPLPASVLPPGTWAAVDMPVEDPVGGLRTTGGWVVSSRPLATWERGYVVQYVPDGGPAVELGSGFETPGWLARTGDDVYVGFEDVGGVGPGRLFHVAGDRLEPVDLPFGHVAATADRLFVATGWELTARAFTLFEATPDGPAVRFSGEEDQRTVGLVVVDGRLVLGVQKRDRSLSAPLATRAAAVMEMIEGHPQAAATLAGPPEGYLVHVSLADLGVHSERFPGQRPQDIAVLDGDWLIVVSEGSLAGGQRDAVVVARAPGESTGWRLLARDLEMPYQSVATGRWLCLRELLGRGEVVRCLSPELGRQLVTPVFEHGVRLWDIVPGTPDSRLFFMRQGTAAADRTLMALSLE